MTSTIESLEEHRVLTQLTALDAQLTALLAHAAVEQRELSHLAVRRAPTPYRVRLSVAVPSAGRFELRITRDDDDDGGRDGGGGDAVPISRALARVQVDDLADWSAASASAEPFDEMSLTRTAAPGQSAVRVRLWPATAAPLMLRSAALLRFLGVSESDAALPVSRGDVLRAVHAYVHGSALVDAHSQSVRCDRHLKPVLLADVVPLDKVAELLDAHLTELPPLVVELPIAAPSSRSVALAAVDVPVHAATPLPPLPHDAGAQAEVDALLRQAAASDKRRRFFLELSQRPLDALRELAAATAHDRALADAGGVEPSDETLAALFDTAAGTAADDAVREYLLKHESSRRVFTC